MVDTVKLADDRSGDVVVRLYEALGGRARARLVVGFDADRIWITDLLERPTQGSTLDRVGDAVVVDLSPFEVLTLRLSVVASAGAAAVDG